MSESVKKINIQDVRSLKFAVVHADTSKPISFHPTQDGAEFYASTQGTPDEFEVVEILEILDTLGYFQR